VSCDGSNIVIRDGLSCSVPISALITTPFSLPWGSSIWARVTAINAYGSSRQSLAGNGAIILTIPDAPLSFINLPQVTSASQIGVSWVEGFSNGGTPVIDYHLYYDQGVGNYITLASGITTQFYTAVGLTQGVTYRFKVRSRNAYGTSLDSAELSILAA